MQHTNAECSPASLNPMLLTMSTTNYCLSVCLSVCLCVCLWASVVASLLPLISDLILFILYFYNSSVLYIRVYIYYSELLCCIYCTDSRTLNLFTADPVKAYTLPYWSNPPFLIFDIRALWRPGLSARAPECQKLKIVG